MLRRLYDISNVLCSLRLLEKVPAPTAKRGCRSVFKWLGAPPADQQYQPRAMLGRAVDETETIPQVHCWTATVCFAFDPSCLQSDCGFNVHCTSALTLDPLL